jgi:hypothetical protein
MKTVKIIIGIVILITLSILAVPSIKYLHEIINYYPNAINKSIDTLKINDMGKSNN